MCKRPFLLLVIFIVKILLIDCFDVKFRVFDDVRIPEHDEKLHSIVNKRDMTQFFDKASFSFNGFQKVESVPVMFPLDICLLNLEGVKYASSLHKNKNAENSFAVFRLTNGAYELLVDIALPNAIAMDCKSVGAFGYVAIALNITAPIEHAREGSPIYEIRGDRIRAVQYFATPNMRSVHLRVTDNELFLLQAFHNTQAAPSLNCPYFKWSGTTFNKLGLIPCSNARNLMPFSINYEHYVAVANYADKYGRTNINSEIYKFNRGTQKFQLLQRIKTNGAVDVQHFKVPQNAVRNQHFLIFGNSISRRAGGKPGEHLEADSVFYLYDKGEFVPYQSISLYAVEKFLPIENHDAEKFLLLVACANQDIKIYNLNDWKFELSNVQYTEGALGKGIAKMRVHDEQEHSYLVIANELMADNETNIFEPIFKQEEHVNLLREEIIQWTKANMERLSAIDVQKLQDDVERKLSKFKLKPVELTEIPNANINTVITKSLTYERMHFNNDYWLAMKYAKKALDVLEMLYPAERLHRRQLKEHLDLAAHNLEYEFKEMHLKTLIVRDALKANVINGISTTQPEFKSIKAKKVIVAAEQANRVAQTAEDTLHAEHLTSTAQLNGIQWSDLVNQTLKRHGVQFIKSTAHLQKLQTASINVGGNIVNGHDLNKLVSIDAGDYVINQDVQFAFPLKARDVIINERLNNIHVHKQRFDVLLKRSNETQIIEGAKHFENIRVLEPITISGKTLGAHLQEMQPNKAIHEPLILQGNYSISGDVTIRKMLKAQDLLQLSKQRSLGELLQNGLTVNAGAVRDVNLKFEQPIIANNSIISFINGQDMQQLVRTNVEQVQIIEGEKAFPQSLTVQQGFTEVKQLNGIDTERLEEQLLLKNTNQTIQMPMHFGRVVIKSLQSSALTLNKKPIGDYLTRTANQSIAGTLKVDNLTAQTLNVSSLNTNGNIFGTPLKDIYQQRSKIAPIESMLLAGEHYNGSIYARNLVIHSTINGIPVEQLERQLSLLDGNIKYVGDFHFNYPMNISSLTFEGALNGIKASNFGKSWLQKHGKQSFTAPQTLASVQCEPGLQLAGKLNNRQFADFYEQTYWITRDEHMPAVHFVNPIQMEGALRTHKLNDLFVPADILLRHSTTAQTLQGTMEVHGNVSIKGDVVNVTHVNAHNLLMLQQFLHTDAHDTLHVEHANFLDAPTYQTLNGHNLKRCLDEAWLANENVVLPQHVEIANANFTGLLEFEGPINNFNLNYVQANYVSLTQPQEINTELIFVDGVQFKDELLVDEVYLHGDMRDTQSDVQFNFDKFVTNTLKVYGPQTVSAPWHLNHTLIHGDLENVHINGLNLHNDVVRMDMPHAIITAKKHLKSANIRKLYATPMATMNNVPIADWIKQTVYVYDNVTIYGTTEIDALNLFNGITVRGALNGQEFQADALLLRNQDQTITGNVYIDNTIPAEQRFLTNNIENLNVDSVNDWRFEDFIANVAIINSTQQVNSHLIFHQPITVGNYQSYGLSGSDELEFKQMKREADDAVDGVLQELKQRVGYLSNTIRGYPSISVPFTEIQALPVSGNKLIVLTKLRNETKEDLIGLIDMQKHRIEIYYWSRHSQKLILHKVEKLSDFLKNEHELPKTQKSSVLAKIQQVPAALPQEFTNCTGEYEEEEADCIRDVINDTLLKLQTTPDNTAAHLEQVVLLSEAHLALRFTNNEGLWKMQTLLISEVDKTQETIKATAVMRGREIYIAIAAKCANNEQQADLNIYRSLNGADLEHIQHNIVPKAMDIAFSEHKQLLLHVLTAVQPTELLIFKQNII